MVSSFSITVLGGDLRSVYLCELLKNRGCNITSYGVCTNQKDIDKAHSLSDAIEKNNIIIGPIPTTKDNVHLFSMEKKEDFTLEHVKKQLNQKKFFFGGAIPSTLANYFIKEKIPFFDCMKDDDIALFNGIATAEGTILEAIQHSNYNLHKSKCLILGYGKCAMILAKKLSGLDAMVTICARKESARVTANCFGYDTITLEHLPLVLPNFDFIFNTIPSLILKKELLCLISPDKTIIDIASSPGGIDYDYAKAHSYNAHLCLGLPGKFAPKSSAVILADKLLNLLKERSE